jgi:hypothetical protein
MLYKIKRAPHPAGCDDSETSASIRSRVGITCRYIGALKYIFIKIWNHHISNITLFMNDLQIYFHKLLINIKHFIMSLSFGEGIGWGYHGI